MKPMPRTAWTKERKVLFMKKENLFAHIESLDELKPYICPKAVSVRDWENICLECKGKCDAGKRAIQILDEATKPDIPKKGGRGIIGDNMSKKRVEFQKQQRQNTYDTARKVFGKAVAENRDPREVFGELAGIKPTVARHRIEGWIRNFPDLDKELHMFDIMGKYVRHRSDTLARRQTHTEQPIPNTSDEISIGDILKAADEGRVKTDSVEETEDGVQVKAHIESAQKQVNEKLNERQCVTLQDVYDQLGVPYDPDRDYWFNPAVEEKKIETIYAGTKPQDNVNRPGHYTFGAIEVIDYIRDKMTPEMFQGFCMGNVLKYVSRHKHKNGVEDLKKANVYLGWLIESEEGAE